MGKHSNRATRCRTENGEFLAAFDVALDKNGRLERYQRIGEKDEARGIKLYAESAVPVPWFNNQTYVNTLDPRAIREFIRVTHEGYAKYFAVTRQGLPFYGGNISYHFEAESKGGGFVITASCYRGHLFKSQG